MSIPLPQSNPQEWLARLQVSGYRITAPRRSVVEIIAASRLPMNPAELFMQARTKHPGIGLTTVYRTLEKLAELGLVQRVHQANDCQAYVVACQGHQHILICSNCGRVEYFSGDNIDHLIHQTAADTGYTITDHWLQFFGLCPACQASRQRPA